MTDLTGRMDQAEQNITNLQQQILQKISIDTLSDLLITANTAIALANSSITALSEKISSLQSLYSSLVYQENTRFGYQTGLSGNWLRLGNNLTGYAQTTGNSYTFTQTGVHIVVALSGNNKTVVLPDASGIMGVRYTIKKAYSGNNSITITGASNNQLIDFTGYVSYTGAYQSVEVISSNSGWYVI